MGSTIYCQDSTSGNDFRGQRDGFLAVQTETKIRIINQIQCLCPGFEGKFDFAREASLMLLLLMASIRVSLLMALSSDTDFEKSLKVLTHFFKEN